MYVYVCMYACILYKLCMYIQLYVCMYHVWIYVCMSLNYIVCVGMCVARSSEFEHSGIQK